MKSFNFTKMVASGNDFVICRLPGSLATRIRDIARSTCDRRYGIGADGLLLLERSKSADVKMRVFNADGSEAEMCGNGARCVALYVAGSAAKHSRGLKKIDIETKAGIIESEVRGNDVRIKLTSPGKIKLGVPILINNRPLKVNFINTGVPHTVIFVQGLEEMDVVNLGRQVRYHKEFAPSGTNVNFVEVLGEGKIRIRTYERGVEDETLACGTGSVASALISFAGRRSPTAGSVNVETKGKEVLKVYFDKAGNGFKDVWLEGKAKIVYKGEYYV